MSDTSKMEKVYTQIVETARSCGVKKLVLFGSRARGTNGEKSDIDLAVYGCPDYLEFQDRLEREVWTLLSFDIIDMDQTPISTELQSEIARDGVNLYEKI